MDLTEFKHRLDLHRAFSQEICSGFSRLWDRPLHDDERNLIRDSVCFLTLSRLEIVLDRLHSLQNAEEADIEYAELVAILKDCNFDRSTGGRSPVGFPDPAGYPNLLDWEEACYEIAERTS
jgi:hypothetical protein